MPAYAQPTMARPPCRPRVRREDLRPGEVLCAHCPAKCCRYFALPIDTPEGVAGLRLSSAGTCCTSGAAVFTEEDCWYLLVHNRCKHLRDDHLCDIYDTRPQICRDYTTANCEYDDDWVYDHYWETPEQVEEYAEAVLGRAKGRASAARSREAALVAVNRHPRA